MSTEDNKAIARRYTEELLPHMNPAVLDELCSPDVVLHGPFGSIQGLEAYKQTQLAFLQSFSDMQTIIEDQIAEGDKSVVRYTERGTYTGNIRGIAVTEKPFQTTGITIFRHTADGKIVEIWGIADTLGVMQQLGVIPALGQAS